MPPPPAPRADCPRCPRLAAFRAVNRQALPTYHNAPVPAFGPLGARLLVVGLAPGLHGANRTGRPFTGDYAGDLLYSTLAEYGFAAGIYDRRPDDGLMLVDARVTNAVRCVPPENKPTGAEIAQCHPFLEAELRAMPALRVVVALGRIAHDAVVRTRGLKLSAVRFAHGALHDVADGVTLADSYHCSRYNTNTGRLTPEAFRSVFAGARRILDDAV